jgi:hypothetical protein
MCGERMPERGRRPTAKNDLTRQEFGHEEKWVEGPARPEVNPVPAVRRLPDEAARYEERSERRGTYHASEPAPSFLGLGSAEYEKPEREISWRFWALMLLLLGVVALFGMQWRANRLQANQPEPAKPAATQPESQPTEEPAVRNEPAASEEKQAQPASGAETDKTAKPATEAPASEEAKPKGKSDAAAQPEEPKPESDSAEPEQPKAEELKPETRAAAPREFSDAVVKQADSFIAAGQCNEALRALRGAGENPKAMTKMGAMYLTGTCVEPDRVTAYAWFSQAFAADPHNLRLESTRRSVWSQMTEDERAKVEAGVKAR